VISNGWKTLIALIVLDSPKIFDSHLDVLCRHTADTVLGVTGLP
jgi:hypothetical protein